MKMPAMQGVNDSRGTASQSVEYSRESMGTGFDKREVGWLASEGNNRIYSQCYSVTVQVIDLRGMHGWNIDCDTMTTVSNNHDILSL